MLGENIRIEREGLNNAENEELLARNMQFK
jgi:hypothetical protein